MDRDQLRGLLSQVQEGGLPIEEALRRLEVLPYEDLGFARVDHHRALRTGNPEVIFAPGKTAEHVAQIAQAMAGRGSDVLVTRLDAEKAKEVEAILGEVADRLPAWSYHPTACTLAMRAKPFEDRGRGEVIVACAGTSDLPIAHEALVTAEMMGNRCDLIVDIGVAGLHRLLSQRARLMEAEVIIAVAGMEGALPGVLAGLVARPVIAVPTSVGYGTSFGGISSLLTMLNACSAGLTVVNIDNGFGAAMAASLINRRRAP
jgi:NCAIR mutase (PurE)-related protein